MTRRRFTLREAREHAGLGRERAAALVGVSAKTLERWETANRARRVVVVELARVYGLEVEQLRFEAAPARARSAWPMGLES